MFDKKKGFRFTPNKYYLQLKNGNKNLTTNC